MSELTPEKIFNGYLNGNLDKKTSIHYLKIIIEQNDDGLIRTIALNFLVKIDNNSKEIFDFLTHLMLSDSLPIVRATAATFLK